MTLQDLFGPYSSGSVPLSRPQCFRTKRQHISALVHQCCCCCCCSVRGQFNWGAGHACMSCSVPPTQHGFIPPPHLSHSPITLPACAHCGHWTNSKHHPNLESTVNCDLENSDILDNTDFGQSSAASQVLQCFVDWLIFDAEVWSNNRTIKHSNIWYQISYQIYQNFQWSGQSLCVHGGLQASREGGWWGERKALLITTAGNCLNLNWGAERTMRQCADAQGRHSYIITGP